MGFSYGMGVHQPVCGGRFLVARLRKDNYAPVSLMLVLIPTLLWLGLFHETLWKNMSPALPLVGGGLCLASMYVLFRAWSTEPGILFTHDVQLGPPGQPSRGAAYQRKVIVLDGQHYELIVKRAKFCRETDNCIENFDHFCPWIGNAVGRRNYRYFVMFLSFTNALAIFVGATTACVGAMHVKEHDSYSDFIRKEPWYGMAIALICIYSVVIVLCVGGLWIYHMGLVVQNTTTNEDIKGAFNGRQNPNDQGACRNCKNFWCGKARRSYLADDDELMAGLQEHADPFLGYTEGVGLRQGGIACGVGAQGMMGQERMMDEHEDHMEQGFGMHDTCVGGQVVSQLPPTMQI